MTTAPTERAPRRGRPARSATATPTVRGSSEGEGDRRLGRPPLRQDPRADILRAAAKLFADRGYGDSSLTDVARAMGYTKGAIYNYFSSKQEIYDAIIIATLTGLYETAAETVDPASPPAERLRQYMSAHARYLADNYDAFVTMLVGFSGMANVALKDDALKLRDAHEGQLRAIIADGIADGTFRTTDAAMVGRAVLSLLSWMVRWFRPGGPKSAEDIAADYCELLLGGLLVRP